MAIEIPWGFEELADGFGDVGAHSKLPYLPFYVRSDVFDERSIVIDEDDYRWACQWRWQWNPSKNKKKLYVRRTGKYQGRYISVYLHKLICLRAWGPPPTPSHIIADHRNGNTLDCRRLNLGWETPAGNRQNYNGIFAQQVRMDAKTGGDRLLRAHKFGGLHGREYSSDPVAPPAAQGQGHPAPREECVDAPF